MNKDWNKEDSPIEKIRKFMDKEVQPRVPESACLHKNCSNCHGTGVGRAGTCVHMISCPCPGCSPWMISNTQVQCLT